MSAMRLAWIAALFALGLPVAASAPDWPEGNGENGQRLCNQCRACHTSNQGCRDNRQKIAHVIADLRAQAGG
jgi:cytochrome c2